MMNQATDLETAMLARWLPPAKAGGGQEVGTGSSSTPAATPTRDSGAYPPTPGGVVGEGLSPPPAILMGIELSSRPFGERLHPQREWSNVPCTPEGSMPLRDDVVTTPSNRADAKGRTPGGAVTGSGGEGLAAWRAKRRKKLGDGAGGGSGTGDGGDASGGATGLNPPRDPQAESDNAMGLREGGYLPRARPLQCMLQWAAFLDKRANACLVKLLFTKWVHATDVSCILIEANLHSANELLASSLQTWALNARAAAQSRGRLEESLIGDRNSSLTWAWGGWSKAAKERVHSRHVADEWFSARSSKCMSGCFAVWKFSIGDARRERRCASVADAAARRRTRQILSASIGAWHTLLVRRRIALSGSCFVALPRWASRLDRKWSSQQNAGSGAGALAGARSGRSGGPWRRAVDETGECVSWRVRHSDVHAHPSHVRRLCANALVKDGAAGGGNRARLMVSLSCWAAHAHIVARASKLATVAIGYAQLCADKSRQNLCVAFRGWLGLCSLSRAMLRSLRIADSAAKNRIRSVVWDAWLRWRLCVSILGREHEFSQRVLEEDWEEENQEEEEEAQGRETLFSSLAQGSRSLSRPRASQHASLGAVSLHDSTSARASGAKSGDGGMSVSAGDGSVRGDARESQAGGESGDRIGGKAGMIAGMVGDSASRDAESAHGHQHIESQSVASGVRTAIKAGGGGNARVVGPSPELEMVMAARRQWEQDDDQVASLGAGREGKRGGQGGGGEGGGGGVGGVGGSEEENGDDGPTRRRSIGPMPPKPLATLARGRLASAETRHEGKGGFVVDDDLKKKLMARRQWEQGGDWGHDGSQDAVETEDGRIEDGEPAERAKGERASTDNQRGKAGTSPQEDAAVRDAPSPPSRAAERGPGGAASRRSSMTATEAVFSRGASPINLEGHESGPSRRIAEESRGAGKPGVGGEAAPKQLVADLIGGGPTLGIGPVFSQGMDPREISPITITDLRHGLEILAHGAKYPRTLPKHLGPGLASSPSLGLGLCKHSSKGWTCRRAFNAWTRLHQVIFRAQVLLKLCENRRKRIAFGHMRRLLLIRARPRAMGI